MLSHLISIGSPLWDFPPRNVQGVQDLYMESRVGQAKGKQNVNWDCSHPILSHTSLFSYLSSSQVSWNIEIFCHLHSQAKVHQNGLV